MTKKAYWTEHVGCVFGDLDDLVWEYIDGCLENNEDPNKTLEVYVMEPIPAAFSKGRAERLVENLVYELDEHYGWQGFSGMETRAERVLCASAAQEFLDTILKHYASLQHRDTKERIVVDLQPYLDDIGHES